MPHPCAASLPEYCKREGRAPGRAASEREKLPIFIIFGEHARELISVRTRPGRLSALSHLHRKSVLYVGFCMGAQGAQRPKTAVSGPGSRRSRYGSSRCSARRRCDAFGVFGTARPAKIGVFQPSSPEMLPWWRAVYTAVLVYLYLPLTKPCLLLP